jgi:hypothetical protein
MKKIVFILTLFCLVNIAAAVQTTPAPQPKKDTAKATKTPSKPHVVKGRKFRMRLQQEQIKRHKKGLKEVDSVQKKLNKELHKPNQ